MGIERKLVGLFGLFGIGNIGNDGSLESMLRFLRRVAPQEHLVCICGNPVIVERAFGLQAVPIWRRPRRLSDRRSVALVQSIRGKATFWLHAIDNLRRLKVLIVPGTGILDDFGASPLGWPYDLLSWCLLGRLMGVKVIFASIGAGPIPNPLSRWVMKSAARAAHYRSYRDTVSRTFMESIGFDTRNDYVYPDIAFSLPAPAPDRRRSEDKGRRLTIGVGVMAYHGWRNNRTRGAGIYAGYIKKMTEFLPWLLDQGYIVRLLMGDEADRRAAHDLLQAVRSRRPDLADASIVFEPAQTLHEVMQQMMDTDLVVATRYHNIVCALRIGKPTISIGYAEKNDALLAEMGLHDFCQQIERLDIELLKAQTTRLLSQRAAVERRIREVQARFESRLSEQEDLLCSLIHSSGR